MPQWLIVFTTEGQEDIADLDSETRKRVLEKIKRLRDNCDQINHLPLGYGWQGFFKLRVGDWRVIYQIDYLQKELIIHYNRP